MPLLKLCFISNVNIDMHDLYWILNYFENTLSSLLPYPPSEHDWPQVRQWGSVKKEAMGSALKTHLSAHFRVPQCETVAPDWGNSIWPSAELTAVPPSFPTLKQQFVDACQDHTLILALLPKKSYHVLKKLSVPTLQRSKKEVAPVDANLFM